MGKKDAGINISYPRKRFVHSLENKNKTSHFSEYESFVKCIENGPHTPVETIQGEVDVNGNICTKKFV